MTLTPQREELLKLNEIVVVGQARLADALTAIGKATIERKDTTKLIEAYHRFARSLVPFIERRDKLLRETNERLS